MCDLRTRNMDFFASVLPAVEDVTHTLQRRLSSLSTASGKSMYDGKQSGDQLSIHEWDFAAKR